MADRLRLNFFLLLMMMFSAPAQAGWVQGEIATLQGLDKITARISTLEVEVGTPRRFGALLITIHACTFRPPDEAPEHAALISVSSVDHDGVVSPSPVFQGWMFASSPAVSALEHPVYDITVLSCR